MEFGNFNFNDFIIFFFKTTEKIFEELLKVFI